MLENIQLKFEMHITLLGLQKSNEMQDSSLGWEMLWWLLRYTWIFGVKLHKNNLKENLKLFQKMHNLVIAYTNKNI